MGCGNGNVEIASVDGGTAPLQLVQEPPPLVLQLSVGCAEAVNGPEPTEFRAIEVVTPEARLFIHERKVTVDGCARRRAGSKSRQLRVVAISRGSSAKHFAREQRLAPERDESLRVEVPGMQRPESQSDD